MVQGEMLLLCFTLIGALVILGSAKNKRWKVMGLLALILASIVGFIEAFERSTNVPLLVFGSWIVATLITPVTPRKAPKPATKEILPVPKPQIVEAPSSSITTGESELERIRAIRAARRRSFKTKLHPCLHAEELRAKGEVRCEYTQELCSCNEKGVNERGYQCNFYDTGEEADASS